MAESAMWALTEEFALQANAPVPGWGTCAARIVYACDDGRQMTVAATEPRTWAALCEGLEAPDLAGHRLGLDPDEPVQARLTELFATRPAADWVSRPGLAGGVGAVDRKSTRLNSSH